MMKVAMEFSRQSVQISLSAIVILTLSFASLETLGQTKKASPKDAAPSLNDFKMDPFEFEIPNDNVMQEVQERNNILEQSVFQQVRIGDKFYASNQFADAFSAYKRALAIIDRSKLGNGSYITSVKNKIDKRMLLARKQWAISIVRDAKKAYLNGLTQQNSPDAVAGFKNAAKLAESALPVYYAGKTISEANYDSKALQRISKDDPSFYKSVTTFMEDCDKMVEAIQFRNETSLSAVDPDNKRRKANIDVLLRESRILYKNKKYEKVRDNMEKVLVLDPYNQDAMTLLNKTYKKLYDVGMLRRENDALERLTEVEWKWNEAVLPEDSSISEEVPREMTGNRSTLYDKLQKIMIDKILFETTDIQSILARLAALSKENDPEGVGVSIIPPPDIAVRSRKIPYLELEKVPLMEVLKYVCELAGLKYKIEDRAVLVGTEGIDDMEHGFFQVRNSLINRIAAEVGPKEEKEEEKTGGIKDRVDTFTDEGAFDEASTELKSVAAVTPEMLKQFFNDRGISFEDPNSSIAFDTKTNKLIVKNTPDNLRRMDALLKEIDIQTPLVLIEAKILEISMNAVEELGFDWTLTYLNTNTNQRFTFGNLPVSNLYRPSSEANNKLINNMNILPNFGSDNQFNLFLSVRAIDRTDRAEVISSPRLLTTSGQEASLNVDQQRYFPDSWDDPEVTIINGTSYTYNPPVPDFEEQAVGTIFKVTPTVSPNNYTIIVKMNTDISKMTGWSNYDYSIIIGGLMNSPADTTIGNVTPKMKMPEFSRRVVDTSVKIYDGETVVIGGILEDMATKKDDKWPFLGDVPMLGRLFTDSFSKSQKTNLLIFVTSRLMKGNGLPVRDSRAQGLFEFTR
ncbi:MAG TPA: hypothetical protein DE060_21240 [Lentisphaeria bacterium]|nr:hypothetical protein [Lentisphaeria bacterium]HCG51714.1 hypothetical protein [Lentisphaeria bacterium]